MDNKYIKLKDPAESRVVKWLQSGCSKDYSRAILSGMHIKNDCTYSADGYKLMRVRTPESLIEYEGLTIKPLNTLTINPKIEEWEVIDGNYPDCEVIIDTGDKEEVFTISVNKKLLADAIKSMPGSDMITFSFTGTMNPITITNDDALLVVMPMKKS